MNLIWAELSQDQAFQSALQGILAEPKLKTFFTFWALWTVLIWVFRAHRLGKVNTLLTRIWTQAWIAIVFWIGFIVAIPFLIWGSPFGVVLSHALRAWVRAIL